MSKRLADFLNHKTVEIHVVATIPENHKTLPLPPDIDDPYCHGSTGTYSGDGWVARTRGDILGSEGERYRIFDVYLYITPVAYREALAHEAASNWRSWHYSQRVVGNDPGPYLLPADPIAWLFDGGHARACWPDPRTVRGV